MCGVSIYAAHQFQIMDWIKLTTKDLECVLNKPQLDILRAQALHSPDMDIAFEVISNVVARIRAEITVSGLNSLDSDHSRIPHELKECALHLCIEALQSRLPSMELSKMQMKHADIARETLMRVARGELPVCRPLFSISTASVRKGMSSSSAKKISTRETMKGI